MSDVRATVREALGDVLAGPTTAATSLAVLVIAAFFLGAQTLSLHRNAAAAMRVAGLLTALAALALGVHSDGWVTGLDTATTSWFVAHRSAGLDLAAAVITDVGSPVAVAAAALIVGAVLSWRVRSIIPGLVVLGTVGAAALASTALKALLDRPRPPLEWRLVLETDPSFPSGHVTGTAALLGIIAVCAGTGRRPAVRALLAAGVIAAVLGIAVTRLYLGVHWLSDVAAGAILAAVFVILGATVYRALSSGPGSPSTPQPVAGAPMTAVSVVAAVLAAATVLGGCGTTHPTPSVPAAGYGTVTTVPPESNPVGDIPDSQAYVPFTAPGGLFTVSVPEGWARSTDGAATVFTDKLNTVRVETFARTTAPNTESISVDELPTIAASTPGYQPGTVTAVQRKAGQVMLISYQGMSPENPVTGKAAKDAFERYGYWRDGQEEILTLSGPVGADNVDPWRTISDSLQWK